MTYSSWILWVDHLLASGIVLINDGGTTNKPCCDALFVYSECVTVIDFAFKFLRVLLFVQFYLFSWVLFRC